MGAYLIGEVVKQTRESLDISQEELCDGICSVETLSRIETGKSAPSRANFEALMERMGKCGKKYLPFVRHTDMETHLMREEIHRDISQFRYAEADEVLHRLEERLNADDPVNHQFVLRYRALVDYELGKIDLIQKRNQLAVALQCTVPKYEQINVLPKGIFNETELSLFCNIATNFADTGDFDTAINMLEQILTYYQKVHLDIEGRSAMETWILNCLSRCWGRKGEPAKARDINMKNKNLLLKWDKGSTLSTTLYNIAFESVELHESEQACKELLLQAFYAAELCQNAYMMQHIKTFVERTYGKEFLRMFN